MGDKNSGGLTEAEKKLVLQMKIQLNAMGVPRNEWAQSIQNEITQYRINEKQKQKRAASENPGGLRKAFQTIGKKVQKTIIKVLSRKSGAGNQPIDDEELERMMQMMGQGSMPMDDDIDPTTGLPKLAPLPDVRKVQQHGTFITPDQQKSTREVVFDDDD